MGDSFEMGLEWGVNVQINRRDSSFFLILILIILIIKYI